MATYSTIKGFTIQSLASDPYASEVLAGTWASGNNVNTIRSALEGCGSLTAGLIAGGNTAPSPAPTMSDKVETYDGTSWSEVNSLLEGRESPGVCGITTAALAVGGYGTAYLASVESYNGTSWSEGNNLAGVRSSIIAAGTTTAAISAGGQDTTGAVASSETWNGTSWTETSNLNTARSYWVGGGTSTAALGCGGYVTADMGKVESYDGTSWTEVNPLNRADVSASRMSMTGDAPSSSTLVFGGSPPVTALTESYNGTSWTEVADLSSAIYFASGGGTSGSSAFSATGSSAPGTKVNSTEVFTVPSTASIAQEGQVWYNTTSTVLKGFGKQGTGAWSSGGTMNTARSHGGGGGDQTAATVAGDANVPASLPLCETYNGSAWTEVNNLTTSAHQESGSSGSSTSMGIFGGAPTPPAAFESWDGTSWTAGSALNSGRYGIAGAGVSATSLLAMGGGDPNTANVEEYNGTSWAEGANLLATTQYAYGQMGSVTACLMAGGHAPAWPSGAVVKVEEWNGTSFTEGNNLNTGKRTGGSAGSTTLALVYGGALWPSGVTAQTESYNGTSWTEVGDLATARYAAQQGQGVNAAMTALSSGGDTAPGKVGATEEWSIPNATKTFTAS